MMDGWLDGWMDGWLGGWMDGWMYGWLGGLRICAVPCVELGAWERSKAFTFTDFETGLIFCYEARF